MAKHRIALLILTTALTASIAPTAADSILTASSVSEAARSIARAASPVIISYVISDRSTMFHAIAGNSHATLILNGTDARDTDGSRRFSDSSPITRDNLAIKSELADPHIANPPVYVALTRIASHIKAAHADIGELYLTDRNWVKASIVVLDRNPRDSAAFMAALKDGGLAADNPDRSTPTLALRKDTALAREAQLLTSVNGPVRFSTESFGDGTPVYDALLRHARGSQVLVAEREYDNTPSEQAAVARLVAAGADVRLSTLDEKLLLTNRSVFTGSANASPGAEHQLEWGIVTDDDSIRRELIERWNVLWPTKPGTELNHRVQ